jgi:histidinol phosphatase-like PHP family hydrolase
MRGLSNSFLLFVTGFILISCNSGYPKIDLHAHLGRSTGNTTTADAFKKASERSKEMGVTFGIAEELDYSDKRLNDSLLLDGIALAKKNSFYIGIQVSRRDWPDVYSKEVLKQLDYILADALIFPDKEGNEMQIWNLDIPSGDPEEFMDLYVAHNFRVLTEEITIWANPTFLPVGLAPRYDELWTDARMKILIDAAVKNKIAIEINSRYKIPSVKFIKMAKAAGAHFTFGSNQHGTKIGDIYWSINMARKCGLRKDDFFIPKRQLSLN